MLQPSNFVFGLLLLVNNIAGIMKTLLEDGVFDTLLDADYSKSARDLRMWDMSDCTCMASGDC